MATPHPSLRDPGHEANRPPIRLARVPRRVRVPLLSLGAAIVLAGAAVGAVLFTHVAGRQSVLAMAHSVPAGAVLQASDLQVVGVSGDGLAVVPQSDEASIIGRPVAVPLAAGALLTPSDIGSPSLVTSDQAVVGILLKDGAFPPALAKGDHVVILDAGAATAGSGSTPAPAALQPPVTATVISVDVPTDRTASGTVVTVRLSASSLVSVARAAAASRITLALIAPGS